MADNEAPTTCAGCGAGVQFRGQDRPGHIAHVIFDCGAGWDIQSGFYMACKPAFEWAAAHRASHAVLLVACKELEERAEALTHYLSDAFIEINRGEVALFQQARVRLNAALAQAKGCID